MRARLLSVVCCLSSSLFTPTLTHRLPPPPPPLFFRIEETVAALNERDFPTSASLVSYFNKDLVERLGGEFETSLERAVALPGEVDKIQSAAALLADGIDTQFMENKFGADVSEPRKALDALIANALAATLDKNELASAKVCERVELECERVMEREASQPIPSKGKFRKRYNECADRYLRTCVGPAHARNQERLAHAWEREVARFDKEFNDRLLNGVVFVTIAWVVVFRFIIRVAVAETVGWIAFIFLQVRADDDDVFSAFSVFLVLSVLSVFSVLSLPSLLFARSLARSGPAAHSSALFVLPPTGLPEDVHRERHHGVRDRLVGRAGQGLGGGRGQRRRRPRRPGLRHRRRAGGLLLPGAPAPVFLLLLPGADTTGKDPRDQGPRRVKKGWSQPIGCIIHSPNSLRGQSGDIGRYRCRRQTRFTSSRQR